MSPIDSFLRYQYTRKMIPKYTSGNEFNRCINLLEIKLTNNQGVGLKREFRAYGGLAAKYKKRMILISEPDDDRIGVDIVTISNVRNILIGTFEYIDAKYFAVSGPADQEEHKECDYKIVVSERKIGLVKQKQRS